MADETKNNEQASQYVLTIAEGDEERNYTVSQILESDSKKTSEVERFIDESISIVYHYERGLFEVDLHPQDKHGSFDGYLPLVDFGADSGLMPGRYFVLTDPWLDKHGAQGFEKEELAAMQSGELGGLFLACSLDQIVGENVAAIEVKITETNDDGSISENPSHEPFDLFILAEPGTSNFVHVYDVMKSLYVMGAISYTIDGYQAERRDSLPKVKPGRADKVEYPLDKVNSTIWTLMQSGSIERAPINVSRSNSETKIPVFYSVDFSQLEREGVVLSKKLEPYDERVYIASAALFNAGYKIASLQQIYNSMGYRGDASERDNQKINDSLDKMAQTNIEVDNTREAEIYNYDNLKYKGALLPMERIEGVVGGQVVNGVVHFFREPPMITFAKKHGEQITTVDVKLLESPLSKTNSNIRLEDYLIRRISRIKNEGGKISNKMLFETIYKNAGIETPMQRSRATKKIKKLLEHYKENGFIAGYKIKKDGVEVFY